MDVAFRLPGDLPIYIYALVMGIGATLGLWLTAWRSNETHRRDYLNAGLVALVGALVGGRLAYAGFNWPYFQDHPQEIIQVFRGGLSWPGALTGALFTVVILARLTKQASGMLADAILPLATTITVSAWLACWLTGCAYGPVSEAWWALPAWDEWGTLARRWPTQLFGAAFSGVTYWYLDENRDSFRWPGQSASIALLAFGGVYFLLTYLRADPMPVGSGLRLDAWAAVGFATLGMVSLMRLLRRQVLREENQAENEQDSS